MYNSDGFETENGVLLKYSGTKQNITLPFGISEIGGSAFKGSSVQHVILPEGVINISPLAFFDCASLISISLPITLEKIGFSAFRGCRSLEKIDIPQGVKALQWRAFEGCRSLESASLHEGLEEICKCAFENCASLKDISLPSTLAQIGKGAFENCSSLEEISIPEGVVHIGEWAFSGCSSLVKANLGNRLQKLEARIFCGCSSLEAIDIPESVTDISWEAFLGCSSLKEVKLPNGLRRIEEGAFEHCGALGSVNIPLSVSTIGRGAFKSSGLEKSSRGEFIILADGILYGYSGSDCKVTVPDGVKKIGAAFYASPFITEVVLPDSVTKIEEKAFEGCASLEKAVLPEGIKELPRNAFARCSSLKYVRLNDSLKIIGEGAFSFCSALKEIALPSSLLKIGARAFEGCRALYSADIPEQVCSIGYRAFAFCDSLKRAKLPYTIMTIDAGAYDDIILTFCDASSVQRSVYIPPAEDSGWENLFELTRSGLRAFEFASFDKAFERLTDKRSAATTALYRLKNPFELFAAHRKMYSEYIRDNVREAMSVIFDSDDLASLEKTAQSEAFSEYNIDEYIDRASKEGKTDILAYLLDIKNGMLQGGNAAKEQEMRGAAKGVSGMSLTDFDEDEDGEDEDSVWDFTANGGEATLNRYLGNEGHIITPSRLGGADVKHIGAYCFCNLKGLKSVIIPEGVESIGAGAFKGCAALLRLKLPCSITDIADNALLGASPEIAAQDGSYAKQYADKLQLR